MRAVVLNADLLKWGLSDRMLPGKLENRGRKESMDDCSKCWKKDVKWDSDIGFTSVPGQLASWDHRKIIR
jgi:hypothetical protein